MSAGKTHSTPVKLAIHLSDSHHTCQTHNTPVKLRHLLHEIILVDDGSTAPHLQQPLEDYVATLPVPVHIVRQGGRTGLMKARVAGARRASGVTLTFLDSHIDCSVDWLEPLMYRIWQVRLQLVQAS
jgi:glycosyltransferase involved in cell wall biosynthesis